MYKFYFPVPGVLISLETDNINEPVEPVYSVSENSLLDNADGTISSIRRYIDRSYGRTGHGVTSKLISPVDLYSVLNKGEFAESGYLSSQVIEGDENALKNWTLESLGLPPGALE